MKDIKIQKSISVYKCDLGQGDEYDYIEMTDYEDGKPVKFYPAPIEFFKDLAVKFQQENHQGFDFNLFDNSTSSVVQILGFASNFGNSTITFYSYPQQETMLFNNDKCKSGIYQMPGLIWVAQEKKELKVFAVKEIFKNLSPQTILHHPPFMNTSNGRICMGNTEFPDGFDNSLIKLATMIKQSFYESKFTHFGSSGITKTNYYTLLESLIGALKPYPEDELVTLEKNLQSIL